MRGLVCTISASTRLSSPTSESRSISSRSRWLKTSSARPDHQGADYLYTGGRSAGHPVAYRFQVPATDSYDLFMRWPCADIPHC